MRAHISCLILLTSFYFPSSRSDCYPTRISYITHELTMHTTGTIKIIRKLFSSARYTGGGTDFVWFFSLNRSTVLSLEYVAVVPHAVRTFFATVLMQ